MAKQVDLDTVYLRMAYTIAELSQANRKKVGAILVAAKGGIIAEGFNGTPSGFSNDCEYNMWQDDAGYIWWKIDASWTQLDEHTWRMPRGLLVRHVLKTKQEVLHAESNAIMKVARSTNSSDGATLYTTLMPCFECAKLIIQAGIVRVVFSETYPYKNFTGPERAPGIDLLVQAGITVEQLDVFSDTDNTTTDVV